MADVSNEITNTSDMSGITDLATNNEIPLLRDDKTPEDIFNNICNDLRRICKQVKSTIRRNAPSNSTGTGSRIEKTVVLPEISSMLHQKANIIDKLTSNIEDAHEPDFTRFRSEAIMSLPVTMIEETKGCVKAVETLVRLKKENDDYLKLLSEADDFLTDMENTEMNLEKWNKEIMRIQKKAGEEYKEVKRDLARVTDVLFKDEEISSNMYALLEDLVKKSESKSDENEWYECVDEQMMHFGMMLIEAGVVVANPQNRMLVKLII